MKATVLGFDGVCNSKQTRELFSKLPRKLRYCLPSPYAQIKLVLLLTASGPRDVVRNGNKKRITHFPIFS